MPRVDAWCIRGDSPASPYEHHAAQSAAVKTLLEEVEAELASGDHTVAHASSCHRPSVAMTASHNVGGYEEPHHHHRRSEAWAAGQPLGAASGAVGREGNAGAGSGAAGATALTPRKEAVKQWKEQQRQQRQTGVSAEGGGGESLGHGEPLSERAADGQAVAEALGASRKPSGTDLAAAGAARDGAAPDALSAGNLWWRQQREARAAGHNVGGYEGLHHYRRREAWAAGHPQGASLGMAGREGDAGAGSGAAGATALTPRKEAAKQWREQQRQTGVSAEACLVMTPPRADRQRDAPMSAVSPFEALADSFQTLLLLLLLLATVTTNIIISSSSV